MRQYEADTWYDATGRIVFTVSKGLPGVGLPRKAIPGDPTWTLRRSDGFTKSDAALGWEDVRGIRECLITRRLLDDTVPTGPAEHSIQYHAPFDHADREEDYRNAWEALRPRFPPLADSPFPPSAATPRSRTAATDDMMEPCRTHAPTIPTPSSHT